MMTLDIVVVNWNAGDQLRECLASIPQAVRGIALDRVVVVDNASTDGSVDLLDGLELPLTVLRNRVNGGFAAACNQGAAGSVADYVLFLNPDTRLLADSLRVPAAFMGDPAHAGVGICGIQLVDDAGDVSRTSVRFPTAYQMMGRSVGFDRLLPERFPGHFMTDGITGTRGPSTR